MWRSKKGFEEFLSIVKRMDFVNNGETYTTFDYNKRVYIEKRLSVDTLMEFVEEMKNNRDKSYYDTEEIYYIYRLKCWVRQRCPNSDDVFKETRNRIAYYERWLKFNDS